MNADNLPNFKIRSLNSSKIGNLVKIKGIITKCSESKLFLRVACFICTNCNFENYMVINQEHYIPLELCQSPKCQIKGDLLFSQRFVID